MERSVIKVKNVSKMYRLYDKPIDRLKESLNLFGKKFHKEFYALEDICFEVNKGETIGIIGKNGSGKSTLLKIITGVLTQSSGDVEIRGKISALLELGAGFNPEYTGIQNIYLNGTMMGYSKDEIDRKIDDILEFADIGDFVHQPVKTYSSGMFARLAFSVAINVDPDILIVDETLSVGDVFFQNKCFAKFEELKERGITILFVSHDTGSVKQLCSKVLWINDGTQMSFGETKEVCEMYMNDQIRDYNRNMEKIVNKTKVSMEKRSTVEDRFTKYRVPKVNDNVRISGNGDAEIASFFITDENENIINNIEVEKEYKFHVIGKFKKDTKNAILGITMENKKGIEIIGLNSHIYKKELGHVERGSYIEVIFSVKIPKIQRGEYLISTAIASGNQENHIVLAWYHNLEKITVSNEGYNLSLIELDSEVKAIKHEAKNLCFV